MILVISWAMMLNIAKLIRDRMIMQNMADNIALSISTHKARTMNFVASCNYLIGTLLSLGNLPSLVQLPSYNTSSVGAFVFGDYKKNTFHKALDDDVAKMKKVVEFLQAAQEEAMQLHALYQVKTVGSAVADGYALTISPMQMPTKAASEKYFGLKRNMKGITYIKTINTQFSNYPHFVYNPFPGYELLELIKDELGDSEATIVKPILEIILEICGGFQDMKVHSKSDYSWYITDRDNIHKQKIKVSLTKLFPKRNDTPLFAGLLGIEYPVITVFSAAAIYNTKGTMFPSQESEFTGFPSNELQFLLVPIYGYLMIEMAAKCIKINKLFGGIVGIHLAATFSARYIQGMIGEGNSPIKNYEKAKGGGWNAHLVPYKDKEDRSDDVD
jgi:hypothetical protein